jgi:hypothetical protein
MRSDLYPKPDFYYATARVPLLLPQHKHRAKAKYIIQGKYYLMMSNDEEG